MDCAAVPGGTCEGEGGSGTFGGNDPHDSSGTLRYARIEFAGHEFSPNTRSHTNANRAISTWGGQELERTALRFERGIASYPTFELHNGTVVDARAPDGREVELRFLGPLLELDGQWKVLSYKD